MIFDIPTFTGKLPEPEVKQGTPIDVVLKNIPTFPAYKYNTNVDLWSGRQIFSMVIPAVNLKKKNKSYDINESYMNILYPENPSYNLEYIKYTTVKLIRLTIINIENRSHLIIFKTFFLLNYPLC